MRRSLARMPAPVRWPDAREAARIDATEVLRALLPRVPALDRAIGMNLLNLDVVHQGALQDAPQVAIRLVRRDARVDAALDEQDLDLAVLQGGDEARLQVDLQPMRERLQSRLRWKTQQKRLVEHEVHIHDDGRWTTGRGDARGR